MGRLSSGKQDMGAKGATLVFLFIPVSWEDAGKDISLDYSTNRSILFYSSIYSIIHLLLLLSFFQKWKNGGWEPLNWPYSHLPGRQKSVRASQKEGITQAKAGRWEKQRAYLGSCDSPMWSPQEKGRANEEGQA